jgi:hypothetical protein
MRRRLVRIGILLGALVLLGVGVRLALDPFATWRTRVVLSGLEGMRGTFRDVEVSLKDLSYVIHDLRIEKVGAGGATLPFLAVKRGEFGLYGRELLHGRLVAIVELQHPKLNLIEARKEHGESGKGAPEGGQSAKEVPRIGRGIERLAPFRLDRVQVRDGEILWVDAREPERPELWLHRIEATLENFATRSALAKHEPTVLAARGTLQRTGKVSVFATADPLAKDLTFAGQAVLEGLQLEELGALVQSKSGLVPSKGTLDLALRFRAEDGRLSGGVRPILRGADVKAGRPDLGTKLKALLADASLNIFSEKRPGPDVVATTIPIEGSVKGPQVQAVPTILGILRNAFVRGVEDGLAGVPPPKAKENEGVLKQARRALSPERGKQPRAQPSRGGGR